MTRTKNYMCDGGCCTEPHGEVRVYPLGGGANLILCEACFAHENTYRTYMRERYPTACYPDVPWVTAEVYEGAH